jgi:hypothetical protein
VFLRRVASRAMRRTQRVAIAVFATLCGSVKLRPAMAGDIRCLKLATWRRWSQNIVWRFMNGRDMRPVLQLHPVKVHSRGRALALLRHQKRGSTDAASRLRR